MSQNLSQEFNNVFSFDLPAEETLYFDGEFGGKIPTNPKGKHSFPWKWKLFAWITISTINVFLLYGVFRLFSYVNIAKLAGLTRVSNLDLQILPNQQQIAYKVACSNSYNSPLTLAIKNASLNVLFLGKSHLNVEFPQIKLQAGSPISFEVKSSFDFNAKSLLLLIDRISEQLENDEYDENLVLHMNLKIAIPEFLIRVSRLEFPFIHKIPISNHSVKMLKHKLEELYLAKQGFGSLGIQNSQDEDSFKSTVFLSNLDFSNWFQNWSITLPESSKIFQVEGISPVYFQFEAFEFTSKQANSSSFTPFFSILYFKYPIEDAFVFDKNLYRNIWSQILHANQWILQSSKFEISESLFPEISILSSSSSSIEMNSTFKTKLPFKEVCFFSDISFGFILKCSEVEIARFDIFFPKTNSQSEHNSFSIRSAFVFLTDSNSLAHVDPNWSVDFLFSDQIQFELDKIPKFSLSLPNENSDMHFSLPKMEFYFSNRQRTSGIGIGIPASNLLISQNHFQLQAEMPKFYSMQPKNQSLMTKNEIPIGYLSFNGTSLHNEEANLVEFLNNTLHILPFWNDLDAEMINCVLPKMEKFIHHLTLEQLDDFILRAGNFMFTPLEKKSHSPKTLQNRALFRKFLATSIEIACVKEKRNSFDHLNLAFEEIFPFMVDPIQRKELFDVCPIFRFILQLAEPFTKYIDSLALFSMLNQKIRQKFPNFNPKGWENFISHPISQMLIFKFSKTAANRLFLNNIITGNFYNKFLERVSTSIEKCDVSKFVDSKLLFYGADGMNLDEIPDAFVEALDALIKLIFQKCPLETKVKIFTKVITLMHDASLYTMIGTSVSCLGGVAALKLFQLLSDTMSNDDLATSMNAIKSDLPPMKPEILKMIIKKSSLDHEQNNFTNFVPRISQEEILNVSDFNCISKPDTSLKIVRKPVGSATLSQGHLGFMVFGEQFLPVFVKILKYHVYPEFKHEVESIEEIIKLYPTVAPVFEAITEDYENEFRLDLEIKYMKRAYQLYSSSKILVPQFIQSFRMKYPGFDEPKTTCIIVMEYIRGISVDKLNWREILETKLENDLSRLKAHFISIYNLVLDLFYTFMSVGLFKEGFIHGDLHAGNILIQFDYQNPKNNKIIPIDYGNCHELDKRLRNNILMIGIGVELQDAKMISIGLGYDSSHEEDEILWKKQMGDVHYYLEFHIKTKREKENFFIQKLKTFTIFKYFYSLEFRLQTALEYSSPLHVLVSRQMETSKELEGVKDLSNADVPMDEIVSQCEEIIAFIKSPSNFPSNSYESLLFAIIYLYCHAKITLLNNSDSSNLYNIKIAQVIQKIERLHNYDEETMKILVAMLFKLSNEMPVNLADSIFFHQKILEVLRDGGEEFKNEKHQSSCMKFLLEFMPLPMELIGDLPFAVGMESEIQARFKLYLQMNEYRYLVYINMHMSVFENVLQREIYSFNQIITPPKDFKAKAPNFAAFKPSNFRMLNFVREAINYRLTKLPVHRIVGFVTNVAARGDKTLGTGHQIMKVFRSQAMLENVSELLKNSCLDFFDFESLGLKSTSIVGKEVGYTISNGNFLKAAKLAVGPKLYNLIRGRNFSFEADFIPKQPKRR